MIQLNQDDVSKREFVVSLEAKEKTGLISIPKPSTIIHVPVREADAESALVTAKSLMAGLATTHVLVTFEVTPGSLKATNPRMK